MSNFLTELDKKISLRFRSRGKELFFYSKTYDEICLLSDEEVLLLADRYIVEVNSCSCDSWLCILPRLLKCYFDSSRIAGYELVQVLEKIYCEIQDDILKQTILITISNWIETVTTSYLIKDGYYIEKESSFKDITIELLSSDNFNSVIINWLNKNKLDDSLSSTIWVCAFFEEIAEEAELYLDPSRHYYKMIFPVVESYCTGANKRYLDDHVSMITIVCNENKLPCDYCNRILEAMGKLKELFLPKRKDRERL